MNASDLISGVAGVVRKKIALVDDHISNLTVGRNALADVYDVFTVPSGERLLQLMKKVTPDMILLDIDMPEMSGYDVIRKLKSDPDTADIPVVFLTTRIDMSSEIECFLLGAVDYIHKPFSATLLLQRIEAHLLVDEQRKKQQDHSARLEEMVREKIQQINKMQMETFEVFAGILAHRDAEAGEHSERTHRYMRILVDACVDSGIYHDETKDWDAELLVMLSRLHDLGKLSIPDSILCKVGRLTAEEFEQMKQHTTFGAEIIKDMPRFMGDVMEIAEAMARGHHERWDGGGYPHGLSGEEVPLPARLLAIADVYDALVSPRTYKPTFSHEKALEIILEGRGTQFDPRLVDLFATVAHKFMEV